MKRIWNLLLVFAITLALVSCAKSTEEQWQEQYDLGVKYVSEGNYEEAIIAFNTAIEISPNTAKLYAARAEAYTAAQQYAEAEADLQQAIAINEKETAYYAQLVQVYLVQDKMSEAVQAYDNGTQSVGEDEMNVAIEERGVSMEQISIARQISTITWAIEPTYEFDDVRQVDSYVAGFDEAEDLANKESYCSLAVFWKDEAAGLIDFSGAVRKEAVPEQYVDEETGKVHTGNFSFSAGSGFYWRSERKSILPNGNYSDYPYIDYSSSGGHTWYYDLSTNKCCIFWGYNEGFVSYGYGGNWGNGIILLCNPSVPHTNEETISRAELNETGTIAAHLNNEILGEYTDFCGTIAYEYSILFDDDFLREPWNGRDIYAGIPFSYVTVQRADGLWVYLNDDGTENTTLGAYEAAYPMIDGVATVQKDGLWGYVRADGQQLTPFIFEDAATAYGGQAWAKQNGKWGVITLPDIQRTVNQIDNTSIKAVYKDYFYNNFSTTDTVYIADVTHDGIDDMLVVAQEESSKGDLMTYILTSTDGSSVKIVYSDAAGTDHAHLFFNWYIRQTEDGYYDLGKEIPSMWQGYGTECFYEFYFDMNGNECEVEQLAYISSDDPASIEEDGSVSDEAYHQYEETLYQAKLQNGFLMIYDSYRLPGGDSNCAAVETSPEAVFSGV